MADVSYHTLLDRDHMLYGAMNFPVLPVLEEIDEFARLGFDYLELAMDPPMAHYTLLASIQGAISQRLKECGMGLVCHLPTFVSTADLTDSIRQASVLEMHKSLELAADLGAKKVVLHPSMVAGMGGFVFERVKKYAFDFLAEMVEAAQTLDLTICLENMFPRNLFGVEPDDFQEILTTFPSLQITLDTGHANIADRRGDRLIGLLHLFGDRLGHLHFSDNLGIRDDHLAIGTGTVDFKRLIKSLKDVGYDDTLTLEIFDQDRGRLFDSREQLKEMF